MESDTDGGLPVFTGGTSSEKGIKCSFCTKSFTKKSNCFRHEKTCYKNLDSKDIPTFFCNTCGSGFRRLDNLKTHLKKCPNVPIELTSIDKSSSQSFNQTSTSTDIVKNVVIKRRTPCLIPDCGLKFYRKTSLIEHLKYAHKTQIQLEEPIITRFPSFQEFLEWKDEEEERTFSFFSQKNGHDKNIPYIHYYCQHDGTEKLHFKKTTSRCNSKGRIKVGNFCIAKIKLKKNEDGTVVMDYYPTHSHVTKPQDVVHHPIPRHTSQFINQQLAKQVSPNTIFKEVQNMFIKKNTKEVESNKINIVTKKRIRARARRQRNAQRHHTDDAKSVFILAKHLYENDNSILIYKPYGGSVVYGPQEIDNLPNSEELFMLGMQTERQLEIFKKYIGGILLIEEIHGTNQYKYQLLTCMIVDENRQGWPVAHLITSKSDAATMKYFFKCLRDRLGNGARVNCVITDDENAIIDSVNEGFATEIRHILCQWHFLRNLKDNVRNIVPKAVCKDVTEELKVIINEKEECIFSKLCEGFLKKYGNNPRMDSFVAYFKQYYLDRKDKWAMCYRNFPHADVNSMSHIESFHNNLKKVYLEGKVNKRLDDLITILMNMEWEDHCTRVIRTVGEFSTPPEDIAERHEKGMLITDDHVVEVLPNTWEIQCATNKSSCYIVTRYSSFCTFDSCFYRCTKLQCQDLCSHLYSCSCSDRHSLCKHIHKVHSLLSREESCLFVEESECIEEPCLFVEKSECREKPSLFVEESERIEELCLFGEELECRVEPYLFVEESICKEEPCLSVEESDIYCLGNNGSEIEDSDSKLLSEETAEYKKQKTLVEQIGKHLKILNKFQETAESAPTHLLSQVESLLSNVATQLHGEEMRPFMKLDPQASLETQVSQLLPFKRPLSRKRKNSESPSEEIAKKK